MRILSSNVGSAGLLLILLSFSNTALADCGQQRGRAESLVFSIKTGHRDSIGNDRRTEVASQLAALTRHYPNCRWPHRVVADIASLLKDSSDGVRYGAAMSLANIGSQAQLAVPELRRALADSDRQLDEDPSLITPSRYSGQAIRVALRRLTGEKIPEYEDTPRK